MTKPIEPFIPPARHLREESSSNLQPLGLELPNLFAAPAGMPHDARAGEHVKMLGDRLARDGGSLGEVRDRARTGCRQPGDESETRLITQRGE